MTSVLPAPLVELAGGHGVATEFWDWQGNHREVQESTIRTVLGALGVPAEDDEQVQQSLVALREAGWRRVLPPVAVVRTGRPHKIPVQLPAGVATGLLGAPYLLWRLSREMERGDL